MSGIKETAERFKKENGNDSYTQKDMTIYLVDRMDKLYEVFTKGSNKIAINSTNIEATDKRIDSLVKMFKWIGMIIVGLLGVGATVIIPLFG